MTLGSIRRRMFLRFYLQNCRGQVSGLLCPELGGNSGSSCRSPGCSAEDLPSRSQHKLSLPLTVILGWKICSQIPEQVQQGKEDALSLIVRINAADDYGHKIGPRNEGGSQKLKGS